MYTTGSVILHGIFACEIVAYGSPAACGVLFSEGIIVFAQLSGCAKTTHDGLLRNVFNFGRGKPIRCKTPWPTGDEICTQHTRVYGMTGYMVTQTKCGRNAKEMKKSDKSIEVNGRSKTDKNKEGGTYKSSLKATRTVRAATIENLRHHRWFISS